MMGYAKHVGRVGALAVALGIGAVVATSPGVAWAEGTDETLRPRMETPAAPIRQAEPPTPSTEPQDPGEVIRRSIERATDELRDDIRKVVTGVVRGSGGAITSTHRDGSKSSNGNVPPVVVADRRTTRHREAPKGDEKSILLRRQQ